MATRAALLILLSLALSGCKVEISVPEGGHVESVSGKYRCDAGETCVIDVDDLLFDETFVGVPDPGYRFRWRSLPGGFCGGSPDDCRLLTSSFGGNQILMNVLASDETFYLHPKFWTDDQPETGAIGFGTITGSGRVIVNSSNVIKVSDDTSVKLDDDSASSSELKQGMMVSFVMGDDASKGLTGGTALEINAESTVKGPVTSMTPFSVLGQTVIVTGSTVLADMPGGQLNNLSPGDVVEVHGPVGPRGEIQASRVEFKPGGALVWKIRARVAQANTNMLITVGSQRISLVNARLKNCPGTPSPGQLVEIKAAEDLTFAAGNTLDTVESVECQLSALPGAPNPITYRVPAELEGIVTAVDGPNQFRLNGQTVLLLAGTRFEGGNRADIIAGVRLEAEGRLDTDTNQLRARKIKFKQRRVRIEAPLQAGNAGSSSIRLLGIDVVRTPVTEDEDRIFGGGGGLQVEVRGYADDRGDVIAERVRERGDADSGDIRLRGPVSDIVPNTFRILGVTVDISTAREIRNRAGQLIDSATFFNSLSNGTIVSVEDATAAGTNSLNAGKVEIED